MIGNQSIARDKSHWPIGQGQNFQLSKKSKMFKNLSQMSKKLFQLSKMSRQDDTQIREAFHIFFNSYFGCYIKFCVVLRFVTVLACEGHQI